MKTKDPVVAVFLAQPGGTLVGPGKPFNDHWALCRALHEMGAQGVTLPACAPYIDLDAATGSKSADYCRELQDHYTECGTPALRLEDHYGGQRKLVSPDRLARIRDFAPPGTDFSVSGFEQSGSDSMEKSIRASANMGFKKLVTFSGGRAWSAGLYPWPPHPVNFLEYAISLLVLKWQPSLELADKEGVEIGKELHPEEDVHSPLVLKTLSDALKVISPSAANALKANYDASHPTLIGDDAADHAKYLVEHGLLGMAHLKDGQKLKVPGGSLWGDFIKKWSKSRRRFQTFGTGEADWNVILPILRERHRISTDGFPFVVEAECSRFKNMLQGLEIGIENARRAARGEDLLDVAGLLVKASPLGDWEDAFNGAQTAPELLSMSPAERTDTTEILAKLMAAGVFED
ncbi:MAG: TIM barrel protein [bacterium]